MSRSLQGNTLMFTVVTNLTKKVLRIFHINLDSAIYHPVEWVNSKNAQQYVPVPVGAVVSNNKGIAPSHYT